MNQVRMPYGMIVAVSAMALATQACGGADKTRPDPPVETTVVPSPSDPAGESLLSGAYEQAVEQYRQRADEGEAAAQFTLGVLHALGLGVPADGDAALIRYREAASTAGAEAQYNLAEKLSSGVPGRKTDDAHVSAWIDRLARLGEATNPLRVGSDYPFGVDGLAPDPEEAAEWYTRAAEQAHVMSWYRLGRMHVDGRGVAADPVRAHMWLALCAELDLGDAANRVAVLEETMTPEQRKASAELAARWKASTPQPRPLPAKGPFESGHGRGH